jgi:hypothetical protein
MEFAVSLEGAQPQAVEEVVAAVERLRASFERTGDVTMPEFMQLTEARDVLADMIRRMYEKCIYKDD